MRCGFAMCLLSASSVIALFGCAHWDQIPSAETNVAAARQQRKQQIVESFESRRDRAQLQAAVALWEQGEAAACEKMLLQLLERTPADGEARLWLADLYTEQNNPSAAEQQLRLLLQDDPRNARAHHSMGLLLESLGRSDEAAQHLQQAQRISPNEPLYARSLQAIRTAQAQ